MNARQLIEAEDPKAFLRKHAPTRIIDFVCPVQGREDEYHPELGLMSRVTVNGTNLPRANLPLNEIRSFEDGNPAYEWPELYVYEILGWCEDHNVEVLDAWAVYPDNRILLGVSSRLKPRQEAEDPKSILRQAAQGQIWPSRNYFLNVAKPEENWEDGEFCPVQVNPGNIPVQLDGMYGLADDVARAVDYTDGNPAAEEDYAKGMDHYSVQYYDNGVMKGRTSGTADGVAGPRKWRLVYVGDTQDWNADNTVPVEPGKPYGERMPNDESLAAVAAGAILDGEDPKRVFQSSSRKNPCR